MTATTEVRRGRVRKGRVVALLLIVALVLGLGGFAVIAALQKLTGGPADFAGAGTGSVTIEVHDGDTASDIATTLYDTGVVASEAAFVDAAVNDDRSLGIQPGFYQLRKNMSGKQALELILDPASRVQTTVTVPEGLRLDQTVDRLVAETDLPRTDFTTVLGHPEQLGLPSYAEGNPEGYLFPATYTFDPNESAKGILKTMVDRFKTAASDLHLVARSGDAGLTPGEVVTVGSLVQAEVSEADFGKASRVIVNRLAAGMPLQFDSTVNYALNSDDLTLTNDQLGVDSPYNTYQNTGLPPGPINSPGEAAMEAALAPPAGDWLYFVALKPGSNVTRFTADYNEFLQFKNDFYAAVP